LTRRTPSPSLFPYTTLFRSPSNAEQLLKEALTLQVDRFKKAQLKIALADVLVYDKKFNQALIYYIQVQKDLKNDVWGQYARFKRSEEHTSELQSRENLVCRL